MSSSELDKHTLEVLGDNLDSIDDIQVSSRSIDKSDSRGNCVSIQDMDAHVKLKKILGRPLRLRSFSVIRQNLACILRFYGRWIHKISL